VALIIWSARDWRLPLLALLLVNVVPIASVFFRWRQSGRMTRLGCGTLLYHVYFAARGAALLDFVRGKSR
jgi:hypothetical protein